MHIIARTALGAEAAGDLRVEVDLASATASMTLRDVDNDTQGRGCGATLIAIRDGLDTIIGGSKRRKIRRGLTPIFKRKPSIQS